MKTTSRSIFAAAAFAAALTATAQERDKRDPAPADRKPVEERARDVADRERPAQDKVVRGREEAAREREEAARNKARPDGDRPAEARRGERDGDRDAELQKLRAKIEDLAAAGKFDEAAELKKQLAEALEKRGTTREFSDPEIRELQAKLKQLVATERYEEAAAVKRRLGELAERQIDRPKGDRVEKPGVERGENLEAQVRDMMARAEKLHAAGRGEEAEELYRQATALRQRLGAGRERDFRQDNPRGENPEARLKELAAAAEKLRAAGREDEAERVLREAGELKRQIADRAGRGDRPAAPREGAPVTRRDQPAPREGDRGGELAAQVNELRAEMAEMRRVLAELRKQLEEKKR